MKKFFFLLLVACVLSTALPVIALSAESQAATATENSDSEVFVDDMGYVQDVTAAGASDSF